MPVPAEIVNLLNEVFEHQGYGTFPYSDVDKGAMNCFAVQIPESELLSSIVAAANYLAKIYNQYSLSDAQYEESLRHLTSACIVQTAYAYRMFWPELSYDDIEELEALIQDED